MGLFGAWRSKKKTEETQVASPRPDPNPSPASPSLQAETSVFEFGSCARYSDGGPKGAKADEDGAAGKTLAGFCPVSDHLEPCRWELLPSNSEDSPLFRILF